MKKLLTLIVIISLFSCGARKSDKFRTEETAKVEQTSKAVVAEKKESNVKKTENTIVDDKNETITEETTVEPIDPSKPAWTTEPDGTKTELNNTKKTQKKTTQKNNTKIDNSKNSDEFRKSELSELSEFGTKSDTSKAAAEIHNAREAFNFWNLLWLIIPAAVLYWLYKKYKSKIWWV